MLPPYLGRYAGACVAECAGGGLARPYGPTEHQQAAGSNRTAGHAYYYMRTGLFASDYSAQGLAAADTRKLVKSLGNEATFQGCPKPVLGPTHSRSCFSYMSSCPRSGFGIMHRGAAGIGERGVYVPIQRVCDGREILAERDHDGYR